MAEPIPARYIRLRKNPNTRSKVPTKYLTPEQAKNRARNLQKKKDDANPLYDPMAALKGSALKNAANQMAESDVGPEIAGLENERSFLRKFATSLTGEMGNLYSQIGARMAPAVAAEQGASAKLTQSIADRGTQSQQGITAAEGVAQGNVGADPSRGIGLDAGTSQRLAQQFAEQKQVALATTQQQQATADVMNRGFQGLIDTAVAALPAQHAMATGKALAPVTKDIVDAGNEITAAKAKKGGLAMKYLTGLRESEFANEAARQQLNLKTAEVAGVNPITGKPNPPDPSKDKPIQSGAFAGLKPSVVGNMSQKEIDKRVAKYNRTIHPKAKGDSTKTKDTGPFAGMTQAQVDALPQAAKDKKVNNYNKMVHPGAKGDGKGGKQEWIPTVTAKNDLVQAQGALKSVKAGELKSKDGKETTSLKGKSRQQVVDILTGSMHNSLISAVLDSIPRFNNGVRPHLSKATQQKLIKAGYKPSQVAAALGIKTAGQYKKTGGTAKDFDDLSRQVGKLGQ